MSNKKLRSVLLQFTVTFFFIFSSGLSATPAGDNIFITEVEYDPATPPPPNTSFDVENEGEWFELYNPTANAIDIGGWTIKEENTPTYTFPSPTVIAAGDYLLVTNRTDRFQLNYPSITPDLEMDPTGAGLLRLNNTGDQLTLRDTTDAIVDFVAWENNVAGWSAGAVDGPICRVFNVDTDMPADWGDCSTTATPGSGPGFTLSKTTSNITEGGTDTFTVVLTAQPFSDVVIDLSSSDTGAATISVPSVTFDSTNWDEPQTITISAIEDDADLFDENLSIVASVNDASSDNAFDALLDQTLIVNIADNDLAQLSIDDVSQVESDSGDTDYTFTISIDYPSPDEITVDYATADSSATVSDGDYIALALTQATITAGDLSTTVVVKSNGDDKVESDEVFVIDLSNSINATILDAQGEATIENDDSAQLTINDVSQTETDSGILAYTFTITTDNPSDTDITVDYATADLSANVADADYIQVATTQAVIAADVLSTTIVVQVAGDNKVESDEVFLVNLSNPTIATILDGQATGTILNNDTAQLSINDVSQLETDSGTLNYLFTISSSNPSDTNISVDYATADASATVADSDYSAVSTSSASISAGSLTTTIIVSVNGDNKVENDETFFVNLSNPTIATILDAQGVGTIRNNDSAQLSIDDVTETEADSGNTLYTFTISSNNPSDTNISVDYSLADQTATITDSDYAFTPTTQAVITSGSLTTMVQLESIGDLTVEADETFTINLSNPSGATILDGIGIATINNNDDPGFSVNPTSRTIGEGGTSDFTVVLTGQPADDVVINLVSADAGAVTVLPSILTFTNANWNFPQTVTITAAEDDDLANENVVLTASIDMALSDDFFDALNDQTVNVIVQDDDIDTDYDGIPDEDDLDKDNDGNPDISDPRPLIPTAISESFDAEEGSATAFNILTNDDFIPAATISITDTNNGTAAGIVAFDPLTGNLEYTPTLAEVGLNVTIEYRVCNTAVSPEVCAVAVVTVFVNASPIAAPIPTLSEWMLFILCLLLVMLGTRRSISF